MWDFSIGKALGLMARTAPFLVFRIAVYFGVTMALILATGTGAGVGWGVGALGDEGFQANTTFWGGAIGFGAVAGVVFFLRDYLLYIVKAGHIAVMVELLQGGQVPDGRGQIDYATQVVKERFGEASALFALDQLVKGVIGAITGLVQGILSLLPIPGLQNLMGAVRAYLKLAVGLVDEVILAHAIATKSQNPWTSAQTALVYYAQNARPMLINAAWLTLIVWVLSFLVFLLMLAPAAAIVWLIPGSWSAGGLVFAIVFAWAVKVALIEPFALACLLQVYFALTAEQVPDPAWEARLKGASDKFRKLGERASEWMGARTGFGAAREG